jgi:hypothetical protein
LPSDAQADARTPSVQDILGTPAGDDAPAMDHSGHDMPGMDHSKHEMPEMDHSKHDMPEMDHRNHGDTP